MEAYPQKLRELVLDAYEQDMKTAEIARRLKVSPSWCRRVRQRLREHNLRGAIEQKHGPGPKLTGPDRRQLAGLVQENPDATLAELKGQLARPVSLSTIHRALTDMKLTLKKSPSAPANRTART